jgi:transmembrane sensor
VNNDRAKDVIRSARAEASAWIIRLHGTERTPTLEAGFRAWLVANPENARQFERVTEVWDAGAVRTPSVPRVAARSERETTRRWRRAVALSVALLGVIGWVANDFWLNPTYSTGVGEQRLLRLPDGSRLTLNSDSSVVVSYRWRERRLRLERGEAYFEVEKDASRPFRVRADDKQVEALGTTFDVRRDPGALAVTLVEGKVAVTDLERVTSAATLAPGQRLRVSDGQSTPRIDKPRIEAVTAWRRGEVMLDATPLAEAVAEMNRYDKRRLVIEDPSIGTIRISGVYRIGDTELFASMVARLYGFRVEHRRDRIYLVRRDGTFTAGK